MKVIFFANTEWYLYNFRLPLAEELRGLGVEVVFVSPPGPYGEKLRAAGFRWLPLSLDRRSLNPIKEAGVILRLAAIYRRERPDLVHHFTIKSVIQGSLAARLSRVRRRVNAVAGMGYIFVSDDLRAKLLRLPVTWALRLALGGRAARTIFQNPDDLDLCVRRNIAPAASARLILGSGVDTEKFRPERLVGSDRRPRVLMATRLLWDKGVGGFVKAARRVQAEGIDAEFLLAGAPDPGNPKSVQPSQLEQWRAAGAVVILGHRDDMSALLPTVDLVVLPSAYAEGVPRILLEAAASGLAIVTTDMPGCREIVEHGLNGLIVPTGDANALAAAISSLLIRPDERARMGAAGRRKAVEQFDERLVLQRTCDVYRELVPLAAKG